MQTQHKKLKGCGELEIEFGGFTNKGGEVTKDFLFALIENSIKRATEYYDKSECGDHIDSYTEKQLHSVICPAIADITMGKYMIERPSRRKPRGEDEHSGHIDYWASYKHISYLIELKHVHFSYSKDEPRRSITKRFKKAVDQLKDVEKAKGEIQNIGNEASDKKLFGIALEWITFRKRSFDRKKLKISEIGLIKESFLKLKKALGPYTPNIYVLWLPDKRLVKPVKYADCFIKYPAVAFVAKLLL